MYENLMKKEIGESVSVSELPGISCPLFVTYKCELSGKKAMLLESYGENDSLIVTVIGDEIKISKKYIEKLNTENGNFLGYDTDTLLSSGRDLLAEKLLDTDFTLNDLKGILPPSFSNGYICLGYHTSPRLFTVDKLGRIFFQPDFQVDRPSSAAFDPADISRFGQLPPKKISFIDGIIPILFCYRSDGNQALETMYLVEHGDSNFEYSVWIRATGFIDGNAVSVRFMNEGCCNLKNSQTIKSSEFYNALFGVLGHYREMMNTQSRIDIPDKELERVYYGTMMTASNMLNGFQPKYGNMFYGLETHNNFPPNFIMSFAVFAMCGFKRKARLILEHFLNNAVDHYGRMIYRQGETQYYSYSGSEIGQLLWLIERYSDSPDQNGWISEYTDILCRMGDNLISYIAPIDGLDGVYLIHMCAEADTNGRIFDYIQNSLWAIRGLEALDALCSNYSIDGARFKENAELLRKSIDAVCVKYELQTKYGALLPFQLQYTAQPLTLSCCKDTAYPVSEEEYREYIGGDTNPRNDLEGFQNYLENNYANYRYYPEILSSAVLDKKYSDSINLMRERLGGEILCMTRFMTGIDDWPAYNNAIYLLENGFVQKYRMLLYSHILYHGLPDFHIYYEQVGFTDDCMQRRADSCLPSTLLPSFMISQMLAYTSVDGKRLEILKGVPQDWFKKGFSFDNIATPSGIVSVICRHNTLTVNINGIRPDTEIRLYTPKNSEKTLDSSETAEYILVTDNHTSLTFNL